MSHAMNPPPRTILVVDDLDMTRNAIAKAMRSLGYRVLTAADAAETFVALTQELPDVILTDVNLPGVSGRAMLPLLRRKAPGVPVIAFSGLPRDLIGEEFDAVIVKPGSVEEFHAAIERELAKKTEAE